jgi:hypothetical protein
MNNIFGRHATVDRSDAAIVGLDLGDDKALYEIQFGNGYGASIVRNSFSYGGRAGLYEVAVLHGGNLCYTTPVTQDVVGFLTKNGVAEVLDQIAALPAAEFTE